MTVPTTEKTIQRQRCEINQLYNRIEGLESFIRDGHTQECWDYACKTMKNSGVAYCIAKCADRRRLLLSGVKLKSDHV